jgi:hypothetical protein
MRMRHAGSHTANTDGEEEEDSGYAQ